MVRTLKTATTIGATLTHGPLGKPVEHKDDLGDLDKHQLYGLFLKKWRAKWHRSSVWKARQKKR